MSTPITKPVCLFAMVAANRMIGNVEDTPLPFDLPTPAAYMFHLAGGEDGSGAPLRHNFVFGRRVYEEFMGYGVMPVGSGINVVISSTLANKDGSPRPLPATTEADAPANPRIVAVGSVKQALQIGTAIGADEKPRAGELCYVFGGESIYKNTLPHASLLRMVHMHRDFEGGIFFPEYDVKSWRAVATTEPQSEINNVDKELVEFQNIDYVRREATDAEVASIVESVVATNKAFTTAMAAAAAAAANPENSPQ